jgi:hypothetical protein
MVLAGRVTGTETDAGKGALVFGLSFESAARRLATSLRRVGSHPTDPRTEYRSYVPADVQPV